MIDHLDRLDKAVDLIDRTRKEDNKSKIMCQCYHGKHNSVTLLVAYMRVWPPYYNVLEEYSKKYLSINSHYCIQACYFDVWYLQAYIFTLMQK